MDQQLPDEFLGKYEKFLHKPDPLITPENWEYYKTHTMVPEETLKQKFFKSGFDKDLIIQTYSDGNLPKEDLFELFDKVYTKDEIDALADHWCDICLFGAPTPNDQLLVDALLEYTGY